MWEVPPRRPWQVPVDSDALVASALAHARPSSLLGPARLNGASDAVVAEAYQALRERVWALAQPEAESLRRLRTLEESETGATWPPWQTTVRRIGAADDEGVIEAALDVWDALGPNAYALEFKDRPKTGRGFVEGRLWIVAYVLVLMALVLACAEADARYGVPWWLSTPVVTGSWTLVAASAFRASYRRRERIASRELPYP